MVAFTCNACGESVKKAAVEKHYYQCRQTRVVNLTCIDCLQDFDASTYGAHIKCLTENEKYGAKGTVERANNKGELKQQDWLSMIADVYQTHPLDPKHKQILEHIINFDNIPRKKKPFLNFMKSSARMFSKNEAVIESLYDILDKEYQSRNSPNNNAKAGGAQNGKTTEANNCDENPSNDSEVVSEKKKKKKQKHKSKSREDSSSATEEAETSQTELETENSPPSPNETPENGKKTHLSKKEKKEKKKREKYLTELNEIEKYEKSEEDNGAAEEEVVVKKKKDKKNRHKSESEMETNGIAKTAEENVTEEAAPLERKLSKKEKKRKISENAAAEAEAKKKHKALKAAENVPATEKKKEKEAEDDESQEFIKPNKFKIDNVVKIILQSHGGEVALKRLAKRVCTEYQFRCGVQDSDYIMAKFQKKIYNIPGVKIVKDKAVLQ